jgi:4-diphosphocytidyl-2-C-methyl-D-erythritol kinase
VTATAASVEAQGKLNLWLRVLAREAGGYHQLETLFVRIDLSDSVRVATDSVGRELVVKGAALGKPEENLAWRAAAAFAEATGFPKGFHIEIEKRIPVGGGLGGGSADAGAVLRALQALAPTPPSPEMLATIALRLGADVPFLTTDAPMALGWGRGERLLALRSLPARDVLLVLPPFGVETRAAFGWLAESRANTELTAPAARSLDELDRWEGIVPLAGNDFESVVFAHHPELGVARAGLEAAGARIARMSGSGSTLFGVFDRRLAKEVGGLPEGARTVQTRTSTSVASVKLLD